MFIAKRNGQPGYTLVELIVSVSILAVLSTVMIVNYRTAGRSGDLGSAAQKFMSDLRLVQNRALSMMEYNGSLPDGWGMHFDLTAPVGPASRRSYAIFADSDSDGVMDGGETDRVISLPPGVYIQSVSPIPATDRINFIVQPPDPDIVITDDATIAPPVSYADSIDITLGIDGSTATRQITVNRLGLIDLQ